MPRNRLARVVFSRKLQTTHRIPVLEDAMPSRGTPPFTSVTKLSLALFLLLLLPFSRIPDRGASAQETPLLLDPGTRTLLHEALSGETAKEYAIAISRFHRVQGSREYRKAAQYVLEALRQGGFSGDDAFIESFPSDELVWVGPGTRDADYDGKEVAGKIVLCTGYGGDVHRLAVLKYGALAVVCYLDDDRAMEFPDMLAYTGMWPRTEELERVRFGFNLTRRQGERLRVLVEAGQRVVLEAEVEGIGLEPFFMDVPVAVIRGTDPEAGELVYSGHLDHPKESASDNGSGSAAMMDMEITLKGLIDKGLLPRPRRTLRFPLRPGALWDDGIPGRPSGAGRPHPGRTDPREHQPGHGGGEPGDHPHQDDPYPDTGLHPLGGERRGGGGAGVAGPAG
jgi:hypothetical protein